MKVEWTGGLEPELDWMFPDRPADPEMRESASVWLFDEQGRFALPRVGIEAVGKVWDTHRYDMNVAWNTGRVLRESAMGRTRSPTDEKGVASILGSGNLEFRCIEPFQRWAMRYSGEMYEGTVDEQIRAEFGAYVETERCKGLEGRRKVPFAVEAELEMVVPAWVQDYRKEKLAGMTERERTDAGLMGYGYRIEQLFRATGRMTVDGATSDFAGQGSRIHRQSVRPMAAFRGHCWQSCVFPDGRAFGYIAYPPLSEDAPDDTYNNAFLYVDGEWHWARARNIPFLRRIMREGDDVSVEFESELGTTRIGGRTTCCTFHMGNPGVNGFNNQQSGVRYEWDGQVSYGMIERSSPGERCTVVG